MKGLFLKKKIFNFLQLHVSYGFWTEALVKRIFPLTVKYWLYFQQHKDKEELEV